jgi:hypothetical protein
MSKHVGNKVEIESACRSYRSETVTILDISIRRMRSFVRATVPHGR